MHLSRAEKKTVLAGIGSEIRRRRQKLGISQAALATRARVHQNVVGRIELRIYNASVMTLDAIAAGLEYVDCRLLRGARK